MARWFVLRSARPGPASNFYQRLVHESWEWKSGRRFDDTSSRWHKANNRRDHDQGFQCYTYNAKDHPPTLYLDMLCLCTLRIYAGEYWWRQSIDTMDLDYLKPQPSFTDTLVLLYAECRVCQPRYLASNSVMIKKKFVLRSYGSTWPRGASLPE